MFSFTLVFHKHKQNYEFVTATVCLRKMCISVHQNIFTRNLTSTTERTKIEKNMYS